MKEQPLDPPEYHERPEREYNADTTDRFDGKAIATVRESLIAEAANLKEYPSKDVRFFAKSVHEYLSAFPAEASGEWIKLAAMKWTGEGASAQLWGRPLANRMVAPVVKQSLTTAASTTVPCEDCGKSPCQCWPASEVKSISVPVEDARELADRLEQCAGIEGYVALACRRIGRHQP